MPFADNLAQSSEIFSVRRFQAHKNVNRHGQSAQCFKVFADNNSPRFIVRPLVVDVVPDAAASAVRRRETSRMDASLLTCKDVAARLRVSTRQIWKLTAAGRLPKPVRLGRSVRWVELELARFVAGGCRMDACTSETAVRQ